MGVICKSYRPRYVVAQMQTIICFVGGSKIRITCSIEYYRDGQQTVVVDNETDAHLVASMYGGRMQQAIDRWLVISSAHLLEA